MSELDKQQALHNLSHALIAMDEAQNWLNDLNDQLACEAGDIIDEIRDLRKEVEAS